jgi:membrane carboxypeptidase/penicillin-binding protein
MAIWGLADVGVANRAVARCPIDARSFIEHWRYGTLDINKILFKLDSHQYQIMQAGLELGIRDLSPTEMADCYDEMCNCGKFHDPENINKLRTRVIKIMDRLTKALPAQKNR